MNPCSEDIKDFLESESSLALTFATDLFIAKQPLSPDNCVTIYDTPGAPPALWFDASEVYDYPSIQIRIRNINYLNGYSMAQALKTYLHGQAHITINSTYYSLIQCMGDPAFLEWDEKGRVHFIINFNLQRRR